MSSIALAPCSVVYALALGALILAGASAPARAEAQSQTGRLITSQDLASLRDLDSLSVSPDGNWAVFQVRQGDVGANRYMTEWRAVATRGGASRHLADAGEPIHLLIEGRINGFINDPAPVWSPDSRWVAYLRNEGGDIEVVGRFLAERQRALRTRAASHQCRRQRNVVSAPAGDRT